MATEAPEHATPGRSQATLEGQKAGVPSDADLARQADQAEDAAQTRSDVAAAAQVGAGEVKGELSVEAQQSALEWFLSDKEIPVEKTIEVNLGSSEAPNFALWTIQAITGDQIKHARKMAEEGGNRQSRRRQIAGGVVDINEYEANARILVAGSVSPDFHDLAERKGAPKRPDPDENAVMLLMHRLRGKPGIIELLAIEVLALSGYDDENIREHAAGKV